MREFSRLEAPSMIKRSLALSVSLCILGLALSALAQKTSTRTSSGPVPDKAFMQKIWNAWATLNPANAAQFYAKGDDVFFDIAPLKYSSLDEYQKGAAGVLATYASATFTVNDDAQIHNAGQIVWGTATVNYDMVEKSGKHDIGAFRWTVIWQKEEDGKWLTVHEHVSAPLQ
jgi:ketosteroid isomerase-like protein